MPQGRAFEPFIIDKFNGMNTALTGSVPEQFSQDKNEMAEIINFNTNTDGYLEKRKGLQLLTSITTPYTPTNLRVVFLQRTRVGSLANRLFVTDGNEVWRLSATGGTATRLTSSGGNPIKGLQWMVEYGGTATNTAYNCTGVSWNPSQYSGDMTQGVYGFYGDSTVAQAGPVTNSPIGTQIAVHKIRAWVINTLGKYNLAGHESKVWFSQPNALGDFGGAAMNNFNLDFGDGDYLTAMLPFNDQLFFFKSKKTYMVSADGPTTNWQYRLITDQIGCVGRGTVKIINNVVYFLSVDGVVRTDGVTFQNISEPIRDFFDTYRDYWKPETAMNLWASYWDYKYILWMPSSDGNITTAVVFDVRTETWVIWKLTNGTGSFGEAIWDEHYPDSVILGSTNSNRLWTLGASTYLDNSGQYECSFTTRKLDFGSAMKKKRNHLVGLSIGDANTFQNGTVTVTTTADDAVTSARTEAPSTGTGAAANNIKARGAGYGRYFQTKVQQLSGSFLAVYDLTFMNENRVFESAKSNPPAKAS